MIFSFFKKKKSQQKDLPHLKVDLHSHLIPGIDDGSQSMEESLILLKGMEELGYKKMITTPHIMADAYRNTPKIIRDGLKALQQKALEEGLSIEIDAAAEYYLDDGFESLLEKGDILTIKGGYLLFETSYFAKPMQIEEMIFAMSASGYTPLMAHPERYRYVKELKKEYTRFKELGVMFQVNINSFGGHYGKDAKYKADFLSEEGMIDFLGSDVHHKKQVQTLRGVFDSNEYRDIFRNNTIRNDTLI
ncbi:MAG: CpsB/CapC family capsule biosynthesis tyrosine phosphatase [Campylobacterota bacterium]|nr:CpsB/CapC family capsule biosynthesis tyrosine phosphatase [Campylobacterota bacterium]